MRDKILSVIDIGSKYIKSIAIKETDYKILGSVIEVSNGIQDGFITDLQKVSNSIYKTITKLSNIINDDIDYIYCAINNDDIKIHNTTASLNISTSQQVNKTHIKAIMEDAKKKLAKELKNRVLLHSISEFTIDNRKTEQPIGISGSLLFTNTYFVSVPKTLSKNIYNSINILDIPLKRIFFAPLASAMAVSTDSQRETGVAIIDIGANNTSLSIFVDNKAIYSKIIHMAGSSIDKDIAKVFSLPIEEASIIKEKYGRASTENASASKIPQYNITEYELAELIEARLEVILYQLLKAITERNINDNKEISILDTISSIILTGGNANLRDIALLVKKIFNKRAMVKSPNIESTNIKTTIDNPIFASSVGLIKLVENTNEPSIEYKEGITTKLINWYKELF